MAEPPESPDVTRVLADLRQGDPAAANRLMDLVYDQLRGLASGYFRNQPPGQTLQPTALVHEAFLRMVGRDVQWQDRAHFLAVCAMAMRGILTDHARSRDSARRGGAWQRVSLSGVATPSGRNSDDVDIVALDEALTKLAGLHARQARVVECRFFSGMTVDEVAETLSVSRTTVESDWRMARAWLSAELGPGDVA